MLHRAIERFSKAWKYTVYKLWEGQGQQTVQLNAILCNMSLAMEELWKLLPEKPFTPRGMRTSTPYYRKGVGGAVHGCAGAEDGKSQKIDSRKSKGDAGKKKKKKSDRIENKEDRERRKRQIKLSQKYLKVGTSLLLSVIFV